MNFLTGAFLFGLVAAAGPLVIHLLNRRRHRTVEWAAMDFLREAIRRNKRMIEFRDWLLLALRTLAVVLFVLAMARPFWVSEGGNYEGQPVHAVLVVDNSLSMGYTAVDETLLSKAREKAADFVRDLPKGSDISIVPLCKQEDWQVSNVYSTTEDAIEAIDRIEVVDRAARASDGAEAARRAMDEASEIPTKRVVFVGDMQENTWAASDLQRYFEPLGDVQTVQIIPSDWPARTNTAVTEFQLRDGVADAESPAIFLASILHQSADPRPRTRVTLKIDDAVAEERFVDLLPDQNLQLVFEHKFDVAGTPGEPLFVEARLEIAEDNLPQDDFRTSVVPVVARLPVLFVDNEGDREDPDENRYGETWPLRRWLAPQRSREDFAKQLIDVRQRRPSDVSRDDLKDARLVVVAGVESPTPDLVQELREYVEQGGQLLIAAGGNFDPVAWNSIGWQDGAGILPAPLKPQDVGSLPSPTASEWPKFRLAANTCKGEIFQMNLSEREIQNVLASPFFYKAVGVDEQALAKADEAERSRINERRVAREQFEASARDWKEKERAGGISEDDAQARENEIEQFQGLFPKWLAWSNPLSTSILDKGLTVDQLVARARPQILGRYDNGEVFAVRRRVDDGEVIMVTSGCYPLWNNIAADFEGSSMLIFHQILRHLLAGALPNHTLASPTEFTMPIDSRDEAARFKLLSPGDEQSQPINVEALGANEYGLMLRSLGRRGFFQVRCEGQADGAAGGSDGWSVTLAVNGPASESDLRCVDRGTFEDRLGLPNVRWVAADEPISLEGTTYFGHDVWKYLMLAVLLCLALEMILLLPRVMGWMTGNPVDSSAATSAADMAATGGSTP